jgi:RHS repeat-associated protein
VWQQRLAARHVISSQESAHVSAPRIAAKNPLAETAQFQYDAVGNRTVLVAPLGEVGYYGYDALDRLAWLRADALGTDAATYYSYDAVGNRTCLLDAKSHPSHMSYDALGRLLSEQDALGKTEYYAYDAAGNLVMLTNGDGQTAYYSFDAASRVTAIAFPDGAAPSFSYDAAGRLTSAYQSSPSYESDSFEYDPAGRVIARTNWAYGGTLYFQYDLAGRRTAVADPKGGVVYYTYDKRGLITRVDASWGSTFYTFDARGALLTRHLPNNSCTYYAYDAAGRLSKLEDRWDDGVAIQTFEFARDPNGNITQSLREDGSCWYYDYDGLQRLTGAEWKDARDSTLYAFEYEYDKVGNRLRFAQNGVSTYYSYNEANELVSEVTPAVETAYYTYDGRGNQITRSVLAGHTTYFSYNSRNLVSGIWNTDPTFTPNYFEYNALGQRIKKLDSSGTTRYLWDGLNILLELDESGTLKRRYTHGYSPIEGVSSLIAVEGPIQCPCFYHFDQVGAVRQLTDPYHNTIKSYAYEPFGRILRESGRAPNDFMFPANSLTLRDVSQLSVGPFRGYSASASRWTSRDMASSVNRYVFVVANPLALCDPTSSVPRSPLVELTLRRLAKSGDFLASAVGTAMGHVSQFSEQPLKRAFLQRAKEYFEERQTRIAKLRVYGSTTLSFGGFGPYEEAMGQCAIWFSSAKDPQGPQHYAEFRWWNWAPTAPRSESFKAIILFYPIQEIPPDMAFEELWHAVLYEAGSEYWADMPPELLSYVKATYEIDYIVGLEQELEKERKAGAKCSSEEAKRLWQRFKDETKTLQRNVPASELALLKSTTGFFVDVEKIREVYRRGELYKCCGGKPIKEIIP